MNQVSIVAIISSWLCLLFSSLFVSVNGFTTITSSSYSNSHYESHVKAVNRWGHHHYHHPHQRQRHNGDILATSSSSSLLSNGPNGSNGESINVDTNEVYENILCELESEKLYGNTPRLCELDSLANWMRRGKLNIAPKYQRGYVWKKDRASRLVVTVLCNRIVPAIVLHERSKGIFDVVDGKQRLTTLLSFYLAGEDPDLHEKHVARVCSFDTLQKLDENYESLEGLMYNDLTVDRQYSLASYTLPCTISKCIV
jgi:hypothetical protein